MAVWVVRAGENGENEQFALDHGYAVIRWVKFQGPIPVDKAALREAMSRAYSDAGPSDFNQPWNFANKIRKGDLVVIPLKKRNGRRVARPKADGEVAVGAVVGRYEHAPDGEKGTKHRLKVRWINRGVPRARLPGDIAERVCYRQTVFPIELRDAEERIRKIAAGR